MRLLVVLFALVAAACADGPKPWPPGAGDTVFKQSARSVGATVERMTDRAAAHGAVVELGAGDPDPQSERNLFVSVPGLEAAIVAAGPRAGIDLPMRVRVWEDDGAVYLSYQAPSAIARRAGIAPDAMIVNRYSAALDALTDDAALP